MNGRCLWLASGLAAALLAAGGPRLDAQARDSSGPAPTGKAIIAGTVTSDDSAHRPIRRAVVSVSSSELRGNRTAVTTDAGQFEIRDLPAGTYNLSVSKPGYVTTFYGSRRPGRAPGTPFLLADNQRKELDVRETKGGVITGVVTDSFGRALTDVRVSILELRITGGEQRLTTVGNSAQTDEHGVYRTWGLAPGTYMVSATPSFGQVNQIREITSTDMEWVQQQLSGGGRGVLTPAPDAGRTVGYSTVYYPGVVDAASAAKVEVKAGEERGGVSIPLQLVPTAVLSGTVIGTDGQPVTSGAQVTLTQGGPSLAGTIIPAQTTSRGMGLDRSGRFSTSGVPPGIYMLTARGSSRTGGNAPLPPPPPPPPLPPSGGPVTVTIAPPVMPGVNDLWASLEIPVSGLDQTNLVLNLRPGMVMSGRVTFEGASKLPEDFTRVRITISPIVSDGLAQNLPGRPASANGTFTIIGVTPGRYRPSATVLSPLPPPGSAAVPFVPSPWRLKSAIWHGHDLLDMPLDVKPNEDVSDVTLVFTDLTTELSGSLLNGAGSPMTGYVVVVFPTDPSFWIPNARRVRQALPGVDGTFKFTNLPAGSYFMGTVTDLDSSDLSDPSFLEQLSAASLKVTIADGAKVVQSLKLKDPG
jgi:protocatechuate 3,4-dioxygenase beta subunit